jgi:hypothetical protein
MLLGEITYIIFKISKKSNRKQITILIDPNLQLTRCWMMKQIFFFWIYKKKKTS